MKCLALLTMSTFHIYSMQVKAFNCKMASYNFAFLTFVQVG